MASIRKRNGKWQVQVRRKELGAVSQSFTRRDDALRWARIQEQRMEAGTFGHLMPSEVTLGDLLHRYLHAVTPLKKVLVRRLAASGASFPTQSACTQSTDSFHVRFQSSATEDCKMASVQASMIW